jgi:hypothetical protein
MLGPRSRRKNISWDVRSNFHQSLGWAPGKRVGSVIARNRADTACRDGQARGQHAFAFSIIKVSLSNQIQESSCSVDDSRRPSPSLRLCFSSFDHGPKMDLRSFFLRTFATSHGRANWIRTKDDMRNEPEVLGQCLETQSMIFPPTNSCE